MAILLSFSGLPGVGKTTVAKALSLQFPGVYLRVDLVESALRESALKVERCEDAGYLAIAAIARSNLQLGRHVIADTVNPIAESRALWAQTAVEADADIINIEIICSNKEVHRHRVETRPADIEGHPLPDWGQVEARDYQEWPELDLRLDTAVLSVDQAVDKILDSLHHRHPDIAKT